MHTLLAALPLVLASSVVEQGATAALVILLMTFYLSVYFGFWYLLGFVGQKIGEPKGLGRRGFWLGICLGCIGWAVIALMPSRS